MRPMNTAIIKETSAKNTEDCLGSAQLVCLDSQQYLLTPVKLQDVLVTEKTPERKGVKNVERSSFVLTSAEWQKTENDKLKAKQLKEEQQETRKKNRLLKQVEKNKVKVKTTKNKINKTAKETIATKTQKITANKLGEIKENRQQVTNENQINETKASKIQETFINHHHTIMNHQVMIHANNMTSSPENEHPPNIKKTNAEEQLVFPPNKKIKILSDIKLNSPNVFRSSQVDQRDDNQISDPIDKIINNKGKKNYTLLELEKILSEDWD
ncbi:unnamed protein product [Diatraea saccharalis]|uniref:Uncharacterized protein n=1 Tax=Diatraea saccharalis TaxID=40085 RepID=A0A9N9R8L3_9NEOP|nr:unnamed protein product [Diatraea saccharalis]